MQIISRFYNEIKSLIASAIKNVGYFDAGNVTDYNPDSHSVKVMLSPQMIETDWMPIKELAVTANGGTRFAPQVGDPCLVKFYNGNRKHPVYVGAYFNATTPPIGNTEAGEWLFQHHSGSSIKFLNDGSIEIEAATLLKLKAAIQINLDAPLVLATNNLTIANNLSANNGQTTMQDDTLTAPNIHATQDVKANTISLKDHVHGGVTRGGSSTDAP